MGTKKTKAVIQKALIEKAHRKAEEGDSNQPGERDLRFIRDRKVPPPTNDRLVRNMAPAFTPSVVRTLRRPEVVAFLGSRSDPDQLEEDIQLALEGTAVEERFRHGADRAKQMTDPAQVRLMDQGSFVMRNYDDLVTKFPDVADGLQDLADWWSATFPGGPGRPKANGNTKGSGDTKPTSGSGSSGGTTGTTPA